MITPNLLFDGAARTQPSPEVDDLHGVSRERQALVIAGDFETLIDATGLNAKLDIRNDDYGACVYLDGRLYRLAHRERAVEGDDARLSVAIEIPGGVRIGDEELIRSDVEKWLRLAYKGWDVAVTTPAATGWYASEERQRLWVELTGKRTSA